MSLETVKAQFEKYRDVFEDSDLLRLTVDGTLKLINTLEASHYFDDIPVRETLFALEFPVQDREGRIILSYDYEKNKYLIRGQKTTDGAPNGCWFDHSQIYNIQNPIQEIEAYIERVKPQMDIAWKR